MSQQVITRENEKKITLREEATDMYKNHSGSGTKHQEENTEGQIEADKNYQF